ncbi:MAG: hypothetical protein AB8D78_10905 [Akkermansiaceae bacterium]
MIQFYPIRLQFLTALVLSLLPCGAQQAGEVTIQFLSFPKTVDPQPLELLIGEGKTLEVEIPTNELSKPYKIPRMTDWIFGKSVTGEDGKPAFNVFGRAPALAAPNQLILLVRKGANDNNEVEIIPIDNQIANFGGGEFLFINAAKVDIAGQIGDQKFAVKPGKHAIVAPKADVPRKNGVNGKGLANAALYFRKDNEAKPFFRSIWPLNEKARALIFFYHDPKNQGLRMHSIRDFIP